MAVDKASLNKAIKEEKESLKRAIEEENEESSDWSNPAKDVAKAEEKAAEATEDAAREKARAEARAKVAFDEEFKAKRAEEERERKLANMDAYNRKKTEVLDRLSQTSIAKGFRAVRGANQAARSAGRDVARGGVAIIKFIFFVTLIIIVIIASLVGLYSAQGSNCVEYRTPGLQGWDAIWADYLTWDFTKCVFGNLFIDIGDVLEEIDIADAIIETMDQQVYRATGDYYYTDPEQNSEPMGVFIEELNVKDKYYTDQSISVSAKLRVKTIGDKIDGIFTCDIDGIIYDQITPSTGVFSINKEKTQKVVCGWKPDTFTKTDNSKDFELTTVYDFETFAYTAPSVVKSEVWDNLTPEQKSKIRTYSDGPTLKTNVAPMQIGGELESVDDNKVVIIETGEHALRTAISDTEGNLNDIDLHEIPLGITFHADKGKKTWDNGRVNEIKKFVVVMPSGLQLREETGSEGTSVTSCFGYTFTKSESCGDISTYLGDEEDYEFLCSDGDIIYTLDQTGDNQKIRDIDNFKTIECTLTSSSQSFFQDQASQDVGGKLIAIKMFATYEYEVTKESGLNVVRRTQYEYDDLKTYKCSGEIEDFAEKGIGVTQTIRDDYKVKYQTKFRKYLPSASEMEKIRIEALMAAIAEKFAGMTAPEDDENGILDYITGYNKKSRIAEKHDKELEGLSNKLQEILLDNRKDINKTLAVYYNKTNQDYKDAIGEDLYTADTQASPQDYYNWLGTLCEETTAVVASGTVTSTS